VRGAAREVGLAVELSTALDRLAVANDGADQVEPGRWLVKGGGGAHTREKIAATAAACFVVIVSSDKLVDALRCGAARARGLRAHRDAPPARRAPRRASDPRRRRARRLARVDDPAATAALLEATPGVLEHGLFPPALVRDVIVGRAG
jgi:ribose 5-phosphate isomerase A